MGRDLALYPKKASKKELRKHLINLGYNKTSSAFDTDNRSLHYSWFDHSDFKSSDGVYAYISPVSKEEKQFTNNDWALHVRNRYWASIFDVRMMNRTLREGRKKFSGKIVGDYGINRYAPLWDDDSTPISRGISSVYQHLMDNIRKVRHSLPDPRIEFKDEVKNEDNGFFYELISQYDPSRIIYNGLVPFAVSMIEFFFSEVFQILIKYDEAALEKRRLHKLKVNFSDLIDVENENKTIEQVVASSYSFQNITQINKAFKEWVGIDIRGILFKRRKIGNKIVFLENRLSDIIQYRHEVIHNFNIDTTLSREGYLEILDSIEKSIDEITSFLEEKYDFIIDDL